MNGKYLSRRSALKGIGATFVAGSLMSGHSLGEQSDNSPQLQLVGHSLLGNPPGGEAEGDVREDLNLAAVGSFLTDNGTYIVDISTPSNPMRVGHVPLADTRNADVKFHPSNKWVIRSNEPNNANGQGGIEILDVSTPSNPSVMTHYDTNLGGVHNVTPFGDNYVLLSGTGRGMVVLDISNPMSISEVAAFQVGDHVVHDVTTRGDHAFLAHWDAGLRIVDLSTPSNPTEVAAFDYTDANGYENAHFARAHPVDDYVVLGDEIPVGVAGPKHVIEFDLTAGTTNEVAVFSPPQGNAVQPTGLQAFWWTGHNFDFGAGDQSDILFSGDYKAGVQVFDLSDHTDPQHIDEYLPTSGINEVQEEDTGGFIDAVPFTWGAKVKDSGLVYVTDFQTAFYIFELLDNPGNGN